MEDKLILTKDDPTYHLFQELRDRNRLTPIERAEKSYELLLMLHKTSGTHRPIMNGNSRRFMTENIGISKALLSLKKTIKILS